MAIPAGLRSQMPINQTAWNPYSAMRSHSAPGTRLKSTELPTVWLSSASQTQVLTSYKVGYRTQLEVLIPPVMFSPSYGTVAMDQSPIAEGHGGRNIGNDRVPAGGSAMTREGMRLQEARDGLQAWREWGPYLSERQWGTVREDYSDSGDAWNYFTHDQERSRAYSWGEDGIAGISDDKQTLCFSVALWNGKDPILKERLYGLTNSEGNHGEDVKEYYFYLDNTPTHSYMRYLYKYPQREYPYSELVQTNKKRSREDMEYELLDTGIFDDDRYFDVFVEYAKNDPEDILIQ